MEEELCTVFLHYKHNDDPGCAISSSRNSIAVETDSWQAIDNTFFDRSRNSQPWHKHHAHTSEVNGYNQGVMVNLLTLQIYLQLENFHPPAMPLAKR